MDQDEKVSGKGEQTARMDRQCRERLLTKD